MTTQFDISALGLTVTEGGVYSFTLTPKAALGSDTVIRWEIVPKGELPISSSDFSALSGVVNFASGDTDAQTVTLTPSDDSVLEVLKHFELRVYEVVGARDDTSSETDDILIESQNITLSDDETGDYGSRERTGSGDKNVLGAASSEDTAYNGVVGNDTYIITRFQYGDVSISDSLGANLIKFDFDVEITDYSENSIRGGRLVRGVTLTLSTGAEVDVTSPNGFSFQLGDGEVLDYDAFKTAIGASGTAGTSSLLSTYTVTGSTTAPDVTGNAAVTGNRSITGTGDEDILGAANDFALSLNGVVGDDAYIITRFQYGDVNISDSLGANLIKFDFGVELTDYSENSIRGGRLVRGVTLTLSTGAEVDVTSPNGFSFQLGDGEVLDYDAFKTAIGASGTAGTSTLAATYTVTAPQTPTEEPEANNAPTVASAIGSQTATEDTAFSLDISSVFADADGDTLTYSISGNPSWLSFDADTGVFSGTPAQSDTGTYTVTVTATDPEGEAVTDTFDITVENTDNNAPVFEGVKATHLVVINGVEFTYLGDELPEGFFIRVDNTSSTGQISPDTHNGATGIKIFMDSVTRQQIVDIINQDIAPGTILTSFNGYPINYSRDSRPDNDGDSNPDPIIKAVLVDPATGDERFNRGGGGTIDNPPYLFITVDRATTEVTLDENTDAADVVFTATATDADNIAGETATDTITYELVAGAGDSDFFTIDANTGEVRFAATPDYETQGRYVVHVKAISVSTLGVGGMTEVTAQYVVNLNNLSDTDPVVAQEIPDQTTNEGTDFTFTFDEAAFTDADGEVLTYEAALADGSPLPDWLTFDADTRTFSGEPDRSDVGTLNIVVTATDPSGANITDSFDLTVNYVDAAPVLKTVEKTHTAVIQGIEFTYLGDELPTGFFIEIDGTSSAYDIALVTRNGVQGIELDLEQITRQQIVDIINGDLTGTITYSTTDSHGTVYTYTYDIDDARPDNDGDNNPDQIISARLLNPETGSANFAFTSPVDRAEFTTTTTDLSIITWEENADTADVVFTASATDPDNIPGQTPTDTITYELVAGAGDSDLFTIDSATGEVRFAATPDYETKASYVVHVKAVSTSTVGEGSTTEATAQYVVNLNNLNDNGPEFTDNIEPYGLTLGGIRFIYTGHDAAAAASFSMRFELNTNFVLHDINPLDSGASIRVSKTDLTQQQIVDLVNANFAASGIPGYTDRRSSAERNLLRAELVDPSTGGDALDYTALFGGTSHGSEATHNFVKQLPSITIDENTDTYEVVFTARATDADNVAGQRPTETITYELVLGAGDNSYFSIDSATGAVRFKATPDYETKASYEVHVKAISTSTIGTDGAKETTKQYIVRLNDTDDPPVFDVENTAGATEIDYDYSLVIQGVRLTYVGDNDQVGRDFVLDINRNFDFRGFSIDIVGSSLTVLARTFADSVTLQEFVNLINLGSTLTGPGSDDRRSTREKALVRAELVDPSNADVLFDFIAAVNDAGRRGSEGRKSYAFGQDKIVVVKEAVTLDENSDAANVLFTPTATDINTGDTIHYEFARIAGHDNDFFTIDRDTGAVRFAATPDYETQSSYEVYVKAVSTTTAGSTTESVIKYVVELNDINDAPFFADPLAAQTVVAGEPFSLTFDAATDHEGDDITYTATLADGTDLPSWLSFDAAMRTFSGTPPRKATADLTIRITATDTNAAAGTQDFQLVLDRAPLFNLETQPGKTTQAEGVDYVEAVDVIAWDENDTDILLTATATDFNQGDVIHYELDNSITGNDNDFFTIDRDTGAVRFAADPDYETQTSYEVYVKAVSTNQAGGTTQSTIKYTVALNNLDDNAPEFAEEEYSVTISGIKFTYIGDGAPTIDLRFTFSQGTSGWSAYVSRDGNPSIFYDGFQPTRNLTLQHIIDVTSGDAEFSALVHTELAVPDTGSNRLDYDEFFGGTGYRSVATHSFGQESITWEENSAVDGVVFTATATDADNEEGQTPTDTITYELVSGQGDNSFFSIDSATGDVRFLATPDYETQASYVVHVKAISTSTIGTGGTKETIKQYTVYLSDVEETPPAEPSNNAPTVAAAIADQTATEDTAFSLDISGVFADADGDTLTYSVAGASWLTLTGTTLSGTPTNDDVGTHTITLTATDPRGGTVSEDFTITVSNTNDAPTVANEIADQTATEDTAFSLDISGVFADADGDTLTYSVAGASWLTLTGTTLSGTPPAGTAGTVSVTVTASDGTDSVTDTFDIEITAPAPVTPPAGPSDDHAPVFENLETTHSVTIQGIEFTYTGDNFPATGFFVSFTGNSSSWVVQDSTKDGQQGVTFFMLSNITRQQVIDIINGDLTGELNFDPIVDRRDNPQLITARLVELGTGDQTFTSDSHGTLHQFVANPPTISWDENTDASEIVFTATATDADNIAGQTPTETITYELVSGMGDNAYFTIDAATGAVRFAASPDYETKASYEVHVKAVSASTLGDGSTKETTQQYTVNLNDIDETPPAEAGNTPPTVTETAVTVEVGRGATLKLTDLVDDIGWSDPDPDDSVFSYFKIDFGGNHILGGGFYLDGTQQTTADLEALTSGDVEFRAGNKNGAPFTFTLQVGDGGESGTDATDLLPAITVTLDVV